MAEHLPDSAPKKVKQNKVYVTLETLATILVIIGAVLASKGGHTALMAVVFVAAAILFLISALMNISTIKAEHAQMDQAEHRDSGEKK
ncbi:MAG: hypothetical protein PUC71_01195 [Oscillospiraceae bacterium]|nr:hypothetical protein [Oscillospiraceae bacterium]